MSEGWEYILQHASDEALRQHLKSARDARAKFTRLAASLEQALAARAGHVKPSQGSLFEAVAGG